MPGAVFLPDMHGVLGSRQKRPLFLGSQAPCGTSAVRHPILALDLSKTPGLTGDDPGLGFNLIQRGKRSSTDGFCYCTCTKVSSKG